MEHRAVARAGRRCYRSRHESDVRQASTGVRSLEGGAAGGFPRPHDELSGGSRGSRKSCELVPERLFSRDEGSLLAESVKPVDPSYGWFSPEDFKLLVRSLLRFEDRDTVVLVGGQSVTAWALYYGIEVPVTSAPYLTQDADFYAPRQAAEHLAHELGGELRLATMDDVALNVGTIVFRSPTSGATLLIDILCSVHGLSDEEVTKLSIPIEVDGGEIRVLHPLLCLKSRLYNLADIASKRTPEGIAQAQVAMQVASSFLADLTDQRQRLKAIWRIADWAQTRQAVQVFYDYGIDPLKLVDPNAISNPQFREASWPAAVQAVERKRQVEATRRMRTTTESTVMVRANELMLGPS